MIFELVFLFALMLWQHKVEAFLVMCALVLAIGVARRRSAGDHAPFMRSAARDLSRVLTVMHRMFFASMIVIASACGFVTGMWGSWVPMAVSAFAVWATWGTLRTLFPAKALDSPPPST